MSIEARLQELKLELPPVPKPGGIYAPVLIHGDLAYVSGHGPLRPDKSLHVGRVGETITEDEGYQAARAVGLTMLATLKRELGDLDRIVRIVKTLGMVNAAPDFKNHPAVINGFSQLWVDLLGEVNGKGARSAVGMGSLPSGIAVEVEAIFQIRH